MTEYTFISIRWIDGKQRKVIVDICGDIINRNPTKEELKGIKLELSRKELSKNKEYLLEIMRYFEKKEGRVPQQLDFRNNSKYPSFDLYVNMFGTWNKALELARLWEKRDLSRYANEQLLDYLRQFYEEKGRPPAIQDFTTNQRYPGFMVYVRRFGSWENALKLVVLDTDSMIKKGIVKTEQQKGRLAELLVLEHFAEKANIIDLSGENCQSPYDGICPKGQTYDVKSSKLHEGRYYRFTLENIYRDETEWYFLLGFNEDFSKLEHAWRVPALDFVDKNYIYIGINNNWKCNIKNMEQYEITEKINSVLIGRNKI